MFKGLIKRLRQVGVHLEPDRKVLDVVCGMELDPASTRLHVEHKGEVYYFCSTMCKNHFVSDPEKYVG